MCIALGKTTRSGSVAVISPNVKLKEEKIFALGSQLLLSLHRKIIMQKCPVCQINICTFFIIFIPCFFLYLMNMLNFNGRKMIGIRHWIFISTSIGAVKETLMIYWPMNLVINLTFILLWSPEKRDFFILFKRSSSRKTSQLWNKNFKYFYNFLMICS